MVGGPPLSIRAATAPAIVSSGCRGSQAAKHHLPISVKVQFQEVKFEPTLEQKAVVEEDRLKINAYAGGGPLQSTAAMHIR